MVTIKTGPTFSQFRYCVPSVPARWADCTHRRALGTPLVFRKHLLSQKVFRDQKVWESLVYNNCICVGYHFHNEPG
jgi:hypothetical protein